MLFIKGKVKTFSLVPHIKRGMRLLEAGCQGNNPGCCYQLSSIFLVGSDHVNRNTEIAFKYGMKGCELGHIFSCVNVSQMYKRGEGTEKNEELAQLFKKRAQDLHKDARENAVQIEFQKTS